MEALTARGVARGVHHADLDVAGHHHVAAVVGHQLILAEAAGAHHPRHLGTLHVHRATAALEQLGGTVDVVAHHVAADVVGVEVGGQHAGDLHAVGLHQIEEFVDGVRRVDQHAFALLPVADDVHEVHHLLGDRVVDREVAARQQLLEVQTLVGHAGHAIRRHAEVASPARRSASIPAGADSR
jgi:hypothetical protein